MEKKKQENFDFDYPELDLSGDQQSNKPQKDKQPTGEPSKKVKTDQSIQKNNQTQRNDLSDKHKQQTLNSGIKMSLPFFPLPPSGSNPNPRSWVPPPPINTRPPIQNQQQPSYQKPTYQKPAYKNSSFENRNQNRQKKNIVYVKNIPKNFNTQDKLMTFFKNQGVIKQIKVDQQAQSATIRFLKDQHAHKFLKSNKIIFNRSFIIYGEKENITVTQQQINDRITDQQGIVKKTQLTNQKVVKDKTLSELAEQIRALYFFQNFICEEQSQQTNLLKQQVINNIEVRVQLKKSLQNQSEQYQQPSEAFMSDLNWTLKMKRQSLTPLEKKNLFPQFLKYGFLISLDLQWVGQTKVAIQGQKKQGQQNTQSVYQYEVKVLYLSLKHAWSLFSHKNNDFAIQAEGNLVQKYFCSGKLKPARKIQVETIAKKVETEVKLQTLPAKAVKKQEQKPLPFIQASEASFQQGILIKQVQKQ